MSLKMKITGILIIIIVTSSILISAAGHVVLLEGKATDINTGQDLKIKIYFVDSFGKRIPFQTNSKDGKYSQTFNSGDTYLIIAEKYLPAAEDRVYFLVSHAEYLEIRKDFKFTKLEEGLKITSFNSFHPNETTITPEAKETLQWFKHYIAVNKTVNFIFTLNSSDSYLPPTTKKVDVQVKGKTKTKTVKVTTEERLKIFLNERIEVLKNYLSNNDIPLRNIEFRTITKAGKAPATGKKKKTQEQHPVDNLTITSGKVLNL
ncbi:MAG: hypothetical protein HW421_2174 [Ignavibacteria bacterium]|nr:hypothetical protein [Ignavibacteria bacterium]